MEAAEHGEFALVITTLSVNTDLFKYETVFVEENVVATKKIIEAEAKVEQVKQLVLGCTNSIILSYRSCSHRYFDWSCCYVCWQKEAFGMKSFGIDKKKD